MLTIKFFAGSFLMGMYFLIQDSSTHFHENKSDKVISHISLDLAEGGVEFYSKILERNKSIRELMGSDGESYFTPSGDDTTLIRTPSVPITLRLDNCKKHLKAIKQDPSLIETHVAPKNALRLAPMYLDSDAKSLGENSLLTKKT